MRLNSSFIALAAFAAVTSGCSDKQEQPPAPVVANTPEPVQPAEPPQPSNQEVRRAFGNIADSHTKQRPQNPQGNIYYKVDFDIPMRKSAEGDFSGVSVPKGSCVELLNATEHRTRAKISVVGKKMQGYIVKAALRPAPECAP